MGNTVSKVTNDSLNFQQILSDIKLDLFENDNVEKIETEESELGFMFSKGGGSRVRTVIEV